MQYWMKDGVQLSHVELQLIGQKLNCQTIQQHSFFSYPQGTKHGG
jgi:hypothetical protein